MASPNSIMASLWRKVHGMGLTNPNEAGTLLRDIDKRLNRLEAALEELANDRPAAAEATGSDVPVKPEGDDGGRSGSKPRTKGSAPRRGE